MNEAFAPALAFARAFEGRQPAGIITLDNEHRMDEETNVQPALTQFAQNRIDQERHIVIEDFEHRDIGRQAGRRKGDFGGAGLALGRNVQACSPMAASSSGR